MLHLIFQSPLRAETLQRIGEGNAVLFLENAVISLLEKGCHHLAIKNLSMTNRLFVLVSDIETRGISAEEMIKGIAVIDYLDWVALTVQHQPIQSWF